MTKITKIIILGLLLGSCTDAQKAQIGGIGDEFKVQMVNCDGSVTNEWISTGKVLSRRESDSYYFKDKSTGKLVIVSGNFIITQVEKTY